MSYDLAKKQIDREVMNAIELDLDYCGNCFGCSDSPCTATAGNALDTSEDFTAGSHGWSVIGGTVALDAVVGPVRMTKFTDDTTTSNHGPDRSANVSFTNGKRYTISAYVIAGTPTYNYFCPIVTNSAGYYTSVTLNALNGSIGAISGTGHGGILTQNEMPGMELVPGTTNLWRGWITFDWVGATTATASVKFVLGPLAYYTGTGVDYMYISGAVINEGELQPYTKTTGTSIAANSSAGQPCFNTYSRCQDLANFNNSGIAFSGNDTGTNQYIDASAGTAWKISGDVTVLALIKPNADNADIQGQIMRAGCGADEYYGLSHNGISQKIGFSWYDGSFKIIQGATGDSVNGKVLLAGLVRSGLNGKLYINGKQSGSTSSVTTPTIAPTSLRVGATLTSIQQFNGIIFWVVVWNRALTDAEIWTIYKTQNPYSAGGTVLNLAMYEGAGGTVADYSGNGNNGTIYNSPAWVKGAPKTYRITDRLVDLPDGDDYLPLLLRSDTSQSRISPGQGVKLGDLGGVQVQCFDRPHHDRGIDPYWRYRSYVPEDQGTFWGKLEARNQYYEGRTFRIRSGFVNDPFSWDDFVTRTYRFGGWTGPDKQGIVKLNGLDMMLALSDDKIQVPVVTTGTLDANMTSGSTSSFTVTGDSDKYASAGYLAIDTEIIQYTSTSVSSGVTTFSGITRGRGGTSGAAHSAGASVQRCEYFSDTARNLYETLITTYGGVDSTYINTTAWDALATVWFVQTYSRYVVKPTGLTTLLNQLMIETQSFVWWDEENSLFQLGAVKPADTGLSTYDEDSHIIAGSVDIQELTDQRVSDVVVYYNPITPFESEDPQYWSSYEDYDPYAESANQYGSGKQKTFYAYWIGTSGQAAMLSGRHLARYRDNDKRIYLEMDVKDASLAVGDDCYINSSRITDEYGANANTLIQIIQRDEIEFAHRYRYTALLNKFQGRYARIMSATASSVYSSATDDEKALGAYIAAAGGGNFSDGGGAYKIV